MTSTVLITGAAARIGRHIAKGLANDGWTTIIHYNRSAARAEALTLEINNGGGRAFALGANLSVPAERDELINEARELANRPLSALINNASTFNDDRASNFQRGDYDHHMDINLYAPLKLTQDFAAQLPDNQTGCVINMIDQRVLSADPSFFTYGISKAALHAATQTLAQSFAPRVRVNAIGPGPTLQNKTQDEAIFAAEKASTILGIGSPPDTILHGVRYLLSAEAVTGQMIAIDGGQHLIRPKTNPA